MRIADLLPANVPLRRYEVDLVRWQLSRLGYSPDLVSRKHWRADLNGHDRAIALSQLSAVAFVDGATVDGATVDSGFASLESAGTAGHARSRVAAHTYSVHGVHPYRGKFYPQIARSLIVGSNAPRDSLILDPFVGSGTTLVEAALLGFRSIGLDMSPMAVFLSEAKSILLSTPTSAYVDDARRLVQELRQHGQSCHGSHGHVIHTYLLSWLGDLAAHQIDCALHVLQGAAEPAAGAIIQLGLSRRIRSWSLQEPEDLRVRRRAIPPDTTCALDELANASELLLRRLVRDDELMSRVAISRPTVVLGDGRKPDWSHGASIAPGSVGAIVTSPPYATALPYIDTDRLSILALGLPGGDAWRQLDRSLIGSREISTRERSRYEGGLDQGVAELPGEVVAFLRRLQAAVRSDDAAGFRRRNMPAALARYFAGMAQCIASWPSLCRSGTLVAVVVGDSRTKIGGSWREIPTREFLGLILEAHGFRRMGQHDLTDQPAYNRHSSNTIKTESILLHEFAGKL